MSRLGDFLMMRNSFPVKPMEERSSMIGGTMAPQQTGRPQYPERLSSVYDKQAYRKIALVFRCINVLANSIASAPVRVYERGADQQEEEVPDHALRKLMERPNPNMGESVFMATVMTAVASAGFCVIEKVRSGAGRPVELWPLRSDWIMPIPRSDGTADWLYRVPGRGDAVLPAEDALVITFASTPAFDHRGIGPLEVALNQWSLSNTMQDFLKVFFDNNATPVYGLKVIQGAGQGKMTQAQADLIREMWMGRIAGWRDGKQTVPILETVEPVRLGFDFNELAYVDLRDISEIAICQAFGIPGSLVGQRFAQERNTFTNYGEARKSFYQDTVVPLWTRIDDALTLGLLPEFDLRPNILLKFDDKDVEALQEDKNQLADRSLNAFKGSGITRNEFRIETGRAPIDGGDVFLLPFSVVEVPASVKGKRSAAIAVHPTTRALPPGQLDRRSRGLVSLETRDRIERRANRLYSHAGDRYGPKIAAYLQEQKGRVLAALNSSRAFAGYRETGMIVHIRDMSALLGLDWGTEVKELDPLIRQLWNLLGEQAAGDITDILRLKDDVVVWDLANPWVRQVLDDVGPRVTGITETTRQDIAKIVNDSLANGSTLQELSDSLEGLYDETYAGRSMTIARTESMNAYNYASAASFEESGLVSEVELLDNPLHDTDPGSDGLTCAERDGKIVPLADARTHIQAEHPNGSLALAPAGITLGEE